MNRWKLFFQWTLVNTFGLAVIMPIATAASYFLTLPILTTLFRVIRKIATLFHLIPSGANDTLLIMQAVQLSQIPMNILLVALPAFLLGVFQWFILRTHIVNAKRWIWASVGGLGIGTIIIMIGSQLISGWEISETNLELMAGVIIGAALGVAQWLVLRKYVSYSGLWVLANMLAFSTGMIWSYPALAGSGADDIGIIYYFAIFLFKLSITYSVITGIALAWLFNKPPSKTLQTA